MHKQGSCSQDAPILRKQAYGRGDPVDEPLAGLLLASGLMRTW